MNKQTIIFFLGGAAAGAVITLIIEEVRMKAQREAYEEDFDQLIEDCQKIVDEATEEAWGINPDSDDGLYDEERESTVSSGDREGLGFPGARTQAQYHDYRGHYLDEEAKDAAGEKTLARLMESEHPMDDDEEPSDAIEVTPEELAKVTAGADYVEGEKMYERKEAARVKGPHLIKQESYDEDFPEFDKDSLYYYTVNDVLATEDDEVIDNALYIVGECLDKFDFRHNEEETIWIRNAGMNTDYQVFKVRGEFISHDEMG